MAFYEMLPGAGMPPGLQAGMDSVLNKKFGTSTTYPAEGWPDTVNLMGPLPEKTASGAIVTFPDGADGVPLKKCEITLPASLDGYSSVDVVSAGKNLVDFSGHAEPIYSGLTITANADGSITFSGTPSRTWAHLTTDFAVDLPIGTYTLGRGASASYAMYIAVKYEDNTTENISMATSASKTFTTSKRIVQIRLDIATLNQSTNYNETVFAQLEAGATMTDFEPYNAPTTHTASLGRTIYGGTADVVKGTAEPFNIVSLNRSPLREKIDYGITINQQSESVLNVTTNGTAYSCERLFYSLVAGTYTVKFLSTSSDSYTPLISIYRAGGTGIALSINPNTERTFTLSEDTDIDIRLFASGGGDTTIRTVEFSNFQLEMGSAVHDYSPYFEPFTFDPVPIDSKLGNNTIWSEQGSAEVTYRADINLALGGN